MVTVPTTDATDSDTGQWRPPVCLWSVSILDPLLATWDQFPQYQSCKSTLSNQLSVSSDNSNDNKKLSDRRETARQLPTWRGLGPPAHYPSAPSGYTYAYGRIRKPQRTYVKRAVRKAHFKMNRAFKVIQGHPYWCRQESRTVCCRNVQLMPTLFLKLRRYANGMERDSIEIQWQYNVQKH